MNTPKKRHLLWVIFNNYILCSNVWSGLCKKFKFVFVSTTSYWSRSPGRRSALLHLRGPRSWCFLSWITDISGWCECRHSSEPHPGVGPGLGRFCVLPFSITLQLEVPASRLFHSSCYPIAAAPSTWSNCLSDPFDDNPNWENRPVFIGLYRPFRWWIRDGVNTKPVLSHSQ